MDYKSIQLTHYYNLFIIWNVLVTSAACFTPEQTAFCLFAHIMFSLYFFKMNLDSRCFQSVPNPHHTNLLPSNLVVILGYHLPNHQNFNQFCWTKGKSILSQYKLYLFLSELLCPHQQ